MGIGLYRLGNLLGTGNLAAKIFKKSHRTPKNPSPLQTTSHDGARLEHIYQVINGVGMYPVCLGETSDCRRAGWAHWLGHARAGSLIGRYRLTLYVLDERQQNHRISRVSIIARSCVYNISALMADLRWSCGMPLLILKEANMRLMPEPSTGMDDDYKGFIVGFIDCDSYRITASDGGVYPSPVISWNDQSWISWTQRYWFVGWKHDRFVNWRLSCLNFKQWYSSILFYPRVSDRLKNAAHRNTDQFIKERLYAFRLAATARNCPSLKTVFMCAGMTKPKAMFDKAFYLYPSNWSSNAAEWGKPSARIGSTSPV